MDSTEDREYTEFLKKVERTIYLDSISQDVTESVLKAAFNQFGDVVAVQFIPAYLQPNGIHAVLVELKNRKQAQNIITEMDNCPFMVGGIPRPVRAMPAQLEMFADRPRKPGRRISYKWLPLRDTQRDLVKEIKDVVKRHVNEAAYMLEQELEEEAKLAKSQSDTLKVNQKKLELVEKADGSIKQLIHHYRSDT